MTQAPKKLFKISQIRASLTERPGYFEESVVEFFLEVDGQIYRSLKIYVTQKERKDAISDALNEVANMVSSIKVSSINQTYHICRVCNKSFTDLYTHLFYKKDGTMDEEHRLFKDQVGNRGYGYQNGRCFCGGVIIVSPVGNGWEAVCNHCSFLWDED